MSKKSDHERFFWKYWQSGKLPELEDHSEKKLDLLHDYLVLYLEIVLKTTAATGKEVQEITLVDGFAGGGQYAQNKVGSPIAILRAVREAEFRINKGRDKLTRIVPICYFIEQDQDAFASLDATLRTNGYGEQIGKNIHLRRDDFEKCVPEIIADVNARHKKGGNRTIFFLDQCGWTEISAKTIRYIYEQLYHRPEFIVNFAISWLTDFLSAKTQASIDQSLQGLGLDQHVNIPSMMRLQSDLGGRWEHAVEAHIGQGFHEATGIPYFSPFYIEPKGNHRGYWLLHLAGSARARSAMTEIHWSKANRSKHYGHLGYDMLSYKPTLDQTLFIDGMSFDDEAKLKCGDVLRSDFARLLRDSHADGITFKGFVDQISNKVMATAPMVENVVWELCQTRDFEVVTPTGRAKKKPSFADEDRILPRRQFILPGLPVAG
jgi:three-Cys-motif partner protein